MSGARQDRGLDLVVLGLSLSSSWGNGHATTWRALLRGLAALGHRTLFLERDAPWYAEHRDLPDPDFCGFALYRDLGELARVHGGAIAAADAVLVGSYVPEGVAALDLVLDRAGGVVAFYDIDTPVTLAALDRGEPTYVAPRQIPALDAYFSFAGGRALERLRARWRARAALPLWCAVDPALYRPLGLAPEYDLGYLGTYSPDRQPALERLLIEPARRRPDLRFVVGGPSYPAGIAWPANVTRIEHVPPAEHAAFYGRQRFTLNVTRADMAASGAAPSVRLFEAAACGVPIVSDAWDGIEEIFAPGRAIHLARETGDVLAALDAPADWARALAEAARNEVLARHTGEVRARGLAAELSALAAQRAAGTANEIKRRHGVRT